LFKLKSIFISFWLVVSVFSLSLAGSMADYDIATSPAVGDYALGVDISDTTMSTDGTTKRFQFGDLPISTATQTALDAKQDALSSVVVYFDTLSNLQAYAGTETSVYVRGRTTAGDGYEGTFQYLLGDYSAECTADTLHGVYVARSGVATNTGAWVRQYSGPVNVGWFGPNPASGVISYILNSFTNVFFPEGTYTFSGVVASNQVNMSGAGTGKTIVSPSLSSGECCLTLSGAYSSVSDMTIQHASGYGTRVGTGIKTTTHNISIADAIIQYFDDDLLGESDHYYISLSRVRLHNGKYSVTCEANNNNSFYSCYFNSIKMDPGAGVTTGNDIDFYGCDFSTNNEYGDKPFSFVNCSSVSFNGLYSEVISGGGDGTSDKTVFEFVRDGVSTNVPLVSTISNPYCNNTAEYETFFSVDGIPLTINGGFMYGFTYLSKIENNGSVMLVGDGVGGYSAITTLDPAGQQRLSIITGRKLIFGSDTADPTGDNVSGFALDYGGLQAQFSNVDGTAITPLVKINRQSAASETGFMSLYRGGVATADIYTGTDGRLLIRSNAARLGLGNQSSEFLYFTTGAFYPSTDGTMALGGATSRWGTIYAATGTINTSDRNLKESIADVSEAERRVAIRLRSMIRTYRLKAESLADGDGAKIHAGIIAQDVQAAFSIEGLDPGKYALIVVDTSVTDDGRTETRLGVRYDELLCFIISAM